LFRRGAAYGETGDFDSAMADFDLISKLDPKH